MRRTYSFCIGVIAFVWAMFLMAFSSRKKIEYYGLYE
jgi:hypothetical protein